MVKISILYPGGEGMTFDMDYYCNVHMPLALKLATLCRKAEAEKGLSGGAPDTPPAYMAMGHLLFDSVDDFASSFLPHIEVLRADIPNYTNATPILQISEVKM